MLCLLDLCPAASTKLSDLSSVLGAGLSLFLALAVIQTLGSVGVTRLRRRSRYLHDAVKLNRLDGLRTEISKVDAELSQLELSLEALSSRLFYITFFLIVVSLAGLGVAAMVPQRTVDCITAFSIILFYLGLPIFIFIVASTVIRLKSKSALNAVSDCESQVLNRLSSNAGSRTRAED
jgi:hypothetical protein